MNEKWLLQTQNYRAPAERENESEMRKRQDAAKHKCTVLFGPKHLWAAFS